MNFQPAPLQDPIYTDKQQRLMVGTWKIWFQKLVAFLVAPVVNYIRIDTTYSGSVPTTEGTLSWNNQDHTLNIQPDITASLLQVGQESWVRAVNKTGVQINDSQVVYVSGAQGNRPAISLAKADAEATSYLIGVATDNIADNAEGFVTTFGLVRGFNTSSFTAGDKLYLSATTAGVLTKTRPDAPNHAAVVAIALNSTNNGMIFVNPDNGMELSELHDVKTTNYADYQLLVRDQTNKYWKNTANMLLDDANRKLSTSTGDLEVDCGTNKALLLTTPGWRDIHFMQGPTKATGVGNPTLVTWNTVFKGYSYSVGDSNVFDPQEYDHAGKVSATATIHVHFVLISATAGDKINWQIDYSTTNYAGTFPAATTLTAEYTVSGSPVVPYHVIFDIGTFTTLGPGSMMVIKLSRIAKSAGGTNPTSDPVVLGVQYHYPIDTPAGSRQIIVK